MSSLFPNGGLGPLNLSQVGVILFVFLVGLEVRPKSVIVASQASIAAPLLLGGGLAWMLYPHLAEGVGRVPFVLFMSTAMG